MEEDREEIEIPEEERETYTESTEKTREDEILGDTKALLTILKLSIGPLFSQVTNSMYGFISTLWVSKAVGPLAAAALSSSTTFDTLSVSCGVYLSTCAMSKIAALHGEHRSEFASQIIVDLIRFSIVFGALLPAVLIPVAPYLMRWFGAEEDVISLGMDYIIPLLSCSVITIIYLLLCGCLQAEGRTVIFAIAQVSSLILNAGVFNPLFLLVLKMGIRGTSFALIAAQLLPGIVLVIFYFTGNFTAKPKVMMLFSKFSPEVWETLKIGLPSLISAAACTIPSILFIKFIGASCDDPYEFNTMMTLYNAYTRMYQIMIALFMAITSGFLPSASFAFAAGRYRRVLFLLIHTSWIVISIGVLFTVLLYTAWEPLSSLFSSDPFFKERFKSCLNTHWITPALAATQYIATPLLQATQHTTLAFVVAFSTLLLMWPGTSIIMYFTDRHNVQRLFYAVLLNDVLSFILLLPFSVYAIREIACQPEEGDSKENEELKDVIEEEYAHNTVTEL